MSLKERILRNAAVFPESYDMWDYKKHPDGTCELWGSAMLPNNNSGIRNLTLTFPFNMIDTRYSVQATPTGNGLQVVDFGITTGGGSINKSVVGFGFYAELNSAAASGIYFDFTVKGRWK